jgi:hypothetical protein
LLLEKNLEMIPFHRYILGKYLNPSLQKLGRQQTIAQRQPALQREGTMRRESSINFERS